MPVTDSQPALSTRLEALKMHGTRIERRRSSDLATRLAPKVLRTLPHQRIQDGV